MKKTSVIGLTGGIASGKSSVLRWLIEQGCTCLDSDQLARQIVEPGQPALNKIVALFGAEILQPDGQLNRKLLGQRIFADAELREKLNAVTHPAIIDRLIEGTVAKRASGIAFPPLILDIPLLFEGGLSDLADQNWLVWVAPDTQMQRLMQRDQLGEQEARQRLAAQLPLDEKRALADWVIDNDGSWQETEQQLAEMWAKLQAGGR